MVVTGESITEESVKICREVLLLLPEKEGLIRGCCEEADSDRSLGCSCGCSTSTSTSTGASSNRNSSGFKKLSKVLSKLSIRGVVLILSPPGGETSSEPFGDEEDSLAMRLHAWGPAGEDSAEDEPNRGDCASS